MNWIDQNLDAYRVIAEILTDLRPLIRERLEKAFGKEWFRDGIPEETLDRLIRNKEQETSIDWYENRYQEVIGYAVFPDLLDIVVANRDLFGPIVDLAPSPSMLNTRFLELEVMRAKVGRARQISDAEINFLTSFHLRFRKAIQQLKAADAAAPLPARNPDSPTDDVDQPDTYERVEVEAIDEPDDGADDVVQPAAAVTGTVQPLRKPASPGRPPLRLAAPNAPSAPEDAPVADDGSHEEVAVAAENPQVEEPEPQSDGHGEQRRETAATTVKRAMEKKDDRGVLREIYREVTGIAEGIWTAEEMPSTAVWDRVSTSLWYEKSFSRLELRPLSDFYEIISQVRTRRKTGASKTELQSYLNDSKFATILLALRDMFQKNQI